jgi:signal transduction histidine kinase
MSMNAQSALESPDPGTLLSGERKVLELIATGARLETILDTLCRVIDEQSSLMSSIFLLDGAGERLTLTAGPHVPDALRAVVASFPVTVTACGAAVTRREQIISPDIASDPLYTGFHDAAHMANIRAVWSTPFFSRHDRPLGTFAVYSRVTGPPSPRNLELVSHATHLASIAVERKRAEHALAESLSHVRALAARLMQAQDDERRRIARMLHETTAQDLAGLKMLLARLNRTSDRLSDADRALLDDSVQVADRSMNELRTLAYLLHPPFLDEVGLLSAVRWYTQGFADRSGIEVSLDLPDGLARLTQEVETTLFRIIQEALINIHRHAESPTAHIRLRVAADRLTLEIEDHGRGMPPDVVARLMGGTGAIGVGLAGMRERLEQLGGALEIESSHDGTTVRATVPVPDTTS